MTKSVKIRQKIVKIRVGVANSCTILHAWIVMVEGQGRECIETGDGRLETGRAKVGRRKGVEKGRWNTEERTNGNRRLENGVQTP